MDVQITADDKVRTSLALPGDLWMRAKTTAAQRRCSLQDLLIEGLSGLLDWEEYRPADPVRKVNEITGG